MSADLVSPLPPNAKAQNAIWLRISILLILVISAVLLIISFLNYSNYRKNYLEQNLARYLVLAKDLRQSVESGLNIGLSPAANTSLRPILKSLLQQQIGTRFIAVLDESGNILSEGALDTNTSFAWREKLQHHDEYWQASSAQTLELGMPIHNSFNLKVGAVVVGYDKLAIEYALADMQRKLIFDTLLVIALCALLTLVGVWWLTRPLERELKSISGVLNQIGEGEHAPQLPAKLDAGMQEDINLFAHMSHRVLRLLHNAGGKDKA